jgi:hypothetical protein
MWNADLVFLCRKIVKRKDTKEVKEILVQATGLLFLQTHTNTQRDHLTTSRCAKEKESTAAALLPGL